jgi:tetrahydromethanopterin S-methyltransferase subunit B
MELLINVVFAFFFGLGIAAMLSMLMGVLWMWWDMFFNKRKDLLDK